MSDKKNWRRVRLVIKQPLTHQQYFMEKKGSQIKSIFGLGHFWRNMTEPQP